MRVVTLGCFVHRTYVREVGAIIIAEAPSKLGELLYVLLPKVCPCVDDPVFPRLSGAFLATNSPEALKALFCEYFLRSDSNVLASLVSS